MNNGLKSIGLILLGVIAFILWSSIFIVDQREQVLVVRFGKIQRTVTEPGLNFKLPVLDELVRVEKRIMFFKTPDKSVQVVDGRRYMVDAITVLRISDPRKFRESVGASLVRARNRLETRIEAALRAVYGRRTFDAALSKDREAMMREIASIVRPEARTLGIEVVDVRVQRTDLMPEVLKDTYERMNAERFAEAAQLRAVGRAKAAKITAEADRQKVEQVANAQRQAEVIRGAGDAERNAIFARVFGKDKKFFAFYRSMKAYEESLTKGTTLVVEPKSEFFRYFGNSSEAPLKGRAPARAAPAGNDGGSAAQQGSAQ